MGKYSIYQEALILSVIDRTLDTVCIITSDKALLSVKDMIRHEICLDMGVDPKVTDKLENTWPPQK